MDAPKVYVDTTVLKFSATQLPRLRPRKQTITWGDLTQEVIVHDLIDMNPNDFIKSPDLKAEADLLPKLAEAGKQGIVKYLIQMETLFESWGIPKMDSSTGKFYGAPIEQVDAPVQYGRVLIGGNQDANEMQFKFLSGLKHKRFIDLQKMTGAYQGAGKLNRNQLLDAFHIWCAEHNECKFFLTLDIKLIRIIRENSKVNLKVKLVCPSELAKSLGIAT